MLTAQQRLLALVLISGACDPGGGAEPGRIPGGTVDAGTTGSGPEASGPTTSLPATSHGQSSSDIEPESSTSSTTTTGDDSLTLTSEGSSDTGLSGVATSDGTSSSSDSGSTSIGDEASTGDIGDTGETEIDPVAPTVVESELWTFVVPNDVEPRFLERVNDDLVVFVGEDLATRDVVFIGLDNDGQEVSTDVFHGVEGPIIGTEEGWGAFYTELTWVFAPAGPPWTLTPHLVTDADLLSDGTLLLVIASGLFKYHPSTGLLENLHANNLAAMQLPAVHVEPVYFKSATALPDGGYAAVGQGDWHSQAIFRYDAFGNVESMTHEPYFFPDHPLPDELLYVGSTDQLIAVGTVPDTVRTYPSSILYGFEGHTMVVVYSGLVGVLELASLIVGYQLFPTTSGYFYYLWSSCTVMLADESVLTALGLQDVHHAVDPPMIKFQRHTLDGTLQSSSTLDAVGYGLECSSAAWNDGAYVAWEHDFYFVGPSGAPALVFQDPSQSFVDLTVDGEGSATVLLRGDDGATRVRRYAFGPIDE